MQKVDFKEVNIVSDYTVKQFESVMQDAGVDVSEYKFSIYDRCAYVVFLVAGILSVAHLFDYLEFSILPEF